MSLLNQITVLDLTQDFAGSFCAMRLADLGARVIKAEPEGGCAYAKEDPLGFAGPNRDKERITLNLPEDAGKLLQLAKKVDVIIESFRPGVLDSFGCGYETLREENPRLVLASLTAYGQTGPMAVSYAVDDAAVQAFSGAMSITGEPGRPHLHTGYPMPEFIASALAAGGAVAALLQALSTGKGAHVDVAKLDAAVLGMEQPFTQHHMTGKIPVPHGNQHATAVPVGDYVSRDGRTIMLNISSDDQYAKLCTVLGHPEVLETDLRFKAVRGQRRDEVNGMLRAWFSEHTADELSQMFSEQALAYGEANTVRQLFTHPQLLARQTIGKVETPDGEAVSTATSPFRITGQDHQTAFRLHRPGEDTEAVCREFGA